MKKLALLCLLFFLSVIFPLKAEYFYIENYDVVLKVNREQKVWVSENIDAFFLRERHGIIRDIPTKQSHVNNIDVSEPYTVNRALGVLSIKIGEADRLVSGMHRYQIKFQHLLKGKDNEFYYNIIGTDWQVPIKKVRFTVVLPDKINPDNVGISIGKYGTKGFSERAFYEVRDNYVSGYITKPLEPEEGITIHIKMPKGYFVSHKSEWINAVWLGLLICTLLSFLIWHIFGRDEHVTPVVSFYPPPGITSADAEHIYKEKVTKKGMASLIVYLANLGHITIKSDKSDFMLSKVSDYEGDDEFLDAAMRILFRGKYSKSVCGDNLKASKEFYKSWTALERNINSKPNKKRFFEKSSMSFILRLIMGAFLVGNLSLTAFAALDYDFALGYLAPFFSIDAILMAIILMVSGGKNVRAIIFLTLFFTGQFLSIAPVAIDVVNPENLPQVIIGAVCCIISFICFKEMLKPNWYGRQMLGQLLGLKKFIEVAEKQRLEKMVEENPEYFYQILPFAYVLGVSDKWIKQFANIAIPQPEWGDGNFRFHNFDYFTRNFNAATKPSVANGGIQRTSSSGGGGFSGGGFGGGGGRSW
jgi:uncharacterized membrane protein YgcG